MNGSVVTIVILAQTCLVCCNTPDSSKVGWRTLAGVKVNCRPPRHDPQGVSRELNIKCDNFNIVNNLALDCKTTFIDTVKHGSCSQDKMVYISCFSLTIDFLSISRDFLLLFFYTTQKCDRCKLSTNESDFYTNRKVMMYKMRYFNSLFNFKNKDYLIHTIDTEVG